MLNGTGRAGQIDGRLGRARDDRTKPAETVHRRRRGAHGRAIAGRVGRVGRRTGSSCQSEEISSSQLRPGCLDSTQSTAWRGHAVPSDGEHGRMDGRGLAPALVPVEKAPTPTPRRSIPVMPDVMVQEPFQIVQRSGMMFGVSSRMGRRWRRMTGGRSCRVRSLMVMLPALVLMIRGHGRPRGRFPRR